MGRLLVSSAMLAFLGACLLDRTGGLEGTNDATSGGTAGDGPTVTSGAGGVTSGGGASTSTVGGGGTGGEPTAGPGGTGGTGGTGGAGGTGGTGGSVGSIVVACDNGDCPTGQVCCISTPGNDKNGCAAPGTCSAGFEATCDGPQDCDPSEVCCGQWNGSNWTGIGCQVTCDYALGGRTMCDDSNANCPQTEPSCNQSSALPGYYWCD